MRYTIAITEEVFPGFYNTDFDPDSVERYDNDGNLETETLTEEEHKNCTDNLCDHIFSLVKEHTPFKIIEWKLESPNSYNYRNDVLWITVETTPDQILYECIRHVDACDILFSMVDWEIWNDDEYHIAILQQLICYSLFEYIDSFYEQLY